MYRYLAVVWNPHSSESTQTAHSLGLSAMSRSAPWSIAHRGPGVWVVHTGLRGSAQAYPLKSNGGVVLGRLFDNSHDDYVQALQIDFNEWETRRIVASGGQHLIERYWGSYVAIICDEASNKQHVIREPTGNLPCYRTRYRGIDVFFSHVEDCVRLLPITFSIDRRYLTRWLIFRRLRNRDCGLENVEDVPGGERITLSQGNISRDCLWKPTEIARAPGVEDPDEAAREVRSTVQRSVSAWASCYQHVAHRLSGGLDSSIVAACLANAPSRPQVTYLNLSIDVGFEQEQLWLPDMDKRTAEKVRAIAGHGDERYFAHLVAERWKTPLIERERTTSMDLRRLWQTPLTTSPSMYFTMMEMDDAEIELTRAHGAQAFFSGQAGDSIFLATQQPFPAIDYAYLHGIGPGFREHLVATSSLSKESIFTVLRKSVKHGLLRCAYASPVSIVKRPTLQSADMIRDLTDDDFESDLGRLAAGSRLPPGKQNHIRGLAGSAYYDFVFCSGNHADHVDPLNSQPLWELTLQIPTYTLLAGGVSRGLTRRAFADLLPPEIRTRQVKGAGTPFYQQVVRKNSDFLREHLVDGLLVKQGYLDRKKLIDCLQAEEPFRMVYANTMLSYLAAEVWLHHWTNASQKAVVPRLTLGAASL